jgi:hypothetical protein
MPTHRITFCQAVWEVTTIEVDIPEGEDPDEWASDHIDDLVGDESARSEITDTVEGRDTEMTVEPIATEEGP